MKIDFNKEEQYLRFSFNSRANGESDPQWKFIQIYKPTRGGGSRQEDTINTFAREMIFAIQ
ncbi:MAG: hypothetical protein Q4Q17_01490 [Tissierellia bacterium]|nr:hypothetical protein [Tissierellia bacterium]